MLFCFPFFWNVLTLMPLLIVLFVVHSIAVVHTNSTGRVCITGTQTSKKTSNQTEWALINVHCEWTNVVPMCVKDGDDENRCDSHATTEGIQLIIYILSRPNTSRRKFLLISTYTLLSLFDENTSEVFTLNLISQYNFEYIHSYTSLGKTTRVYK